MKKKEIKKLNKVSGGNTTFSGNPIVTRDVTLTDNGKESDITTGNRHFEYTEIKKETCAFGICI